MPGVSVHLGELAEQCVYGLAVLRDEPLLEAVVLLFCVPGEDVRHGCSVHAVIYPTAFHSHRQFHRSGKFLPYAFSGCFNVVTVSSSAYRSTCLGSMPLPSSHFCNSARWPSSGNSINGTSGGARTAGKTWVCLSRSEFDPNWYGGGGMLYLTTMKQTCRGYLQFYINGGKR